ncbi:Uncharacterized protein BP5553_04543 [Venustampulla echinocandica]|uniref:Uncharacterized protein n=1 Tax=Venustampulla echinocandica TaxID=2656787 RepID=A0A370TNL9_9HELO|nr:Uncharacterized protein BP5553_04543 [Venustampulla echinocandica]RDL37110.1 Uncharacterized protein BP5553_04543 [Venustampulla echinocandica]
MPARLEAPVLTVDVGLIHKVDTRNVENLFSMWSGEHRSENVPVSRPYTNTTYPVFSRCSESLEQGRRLENLSWRLWNRETFCCDPVSQANATTPSISRPARSSARSESSDLPSLSGSLDSLADEEAIEFDTESSPESNPAALDIPTFQPQGLDSANSRSRGRERHITPDDLKKMMISIKEEKVLEPLAASVHSYLAAPVAKVLAQQQPAASTLSSAAPAVESGSLTSDSCSGHSSPPTLDSASGTSERSTTSIVRGFSPSHVSSSFRSVPLPAAASTPVTDIAPATPSKGRLSKKPGMFSLGGSSAEDSLSEQANSLETHVQLPPKKKAAMFSFGGSSNEDESSLPQNMTKGPLPNAHKKQASFKESVATKTIQEEQAVDDDVFETDDEDDIDESAIDDDDDSSDWEDSVEDSGNPSIDEKTFFQRVDSRPNLTSRRSLITTMLHQNDRANALAQAAANSQSTPAFQRSRTTSPNGPSLAASPDSDDQGLMMMKKGLKPIPEVPRSTAQPINRPTPAMAPQQALSPRTTRRKMINDELTVSLRQHLVWEHRQKSQTANAVLQRRHTTQDVANLKQYPDKLYMHTKEGDAVNASWNQYFGNGLGEYHSKGW